MPERDVVEFKLFFSDYFQVAPARLSTYGAFNISIVSDLPLFIDPFLLFNSAKPEYRALHEGIIKYLQFVRNKSRQGGISKGLLKAWFTFSEVKQTWLGYTVTGNAGRGLGTKFARALDANLATVFSNFGSEQVTRGTHLEKLCLLDTGIGRDNISDFTTNLVKSYLLEYTQRFAEQHIAAELLRSVAVSKAQFNYAPEVWETRTYRLPWYQSIGDYVLLTPKDLLTKDETWISRIDLYESLSEIAQALPNDQLREQVNNYLSGVLPDEPTVDERAAAFSKVLREFPILIEYYIRSKEDTGDQAIASSEQRVSYTEALFIRQLKEFVERLARTTDFYSVPGNTQQEARARVAFLKNVIENQGGHRILFVAGAPIRREADLHLLFRLTWYGTASDVTREANDGRGPADFKISRGALDKTIVEFKLASNRKLKQNLAEQTEIYQRASDAEHGLKVIVFFSESERTRVMRIIAELELSQSNNVILIDATPNKPSASRAGGH